MANYQLNKNDSLLLIIDLQERLMNAMPDQDRVYKNTNLLIAAANQLAIPVIITEQYPRGLGSTVKTIQDNLKEYKYIEKVSFTALTPEMNDILTASNRKSLIVCGSETHVCVFQTVRDLIALSYNVHLAKDAVCSRFVENYTNGIELMRDCGAVVSNTETIIFDLLKQAGTPDFKAISPLIK